MCQVIQLIFILAKGVKICKRKESEYSNCLKNSIQESWISLAQGNPPLLTHTYSQFFFQNNELCGVASFLFSFENLKFRFE